MNSLRPAALLAALALCACAGCDEQASASPADAAPPPTALPTTSARPSPTATSSTSAEKPELKVLALVFTSEVKKKEPADQLKAAKPGQRVWAHLTLRNRTGEVKPVSLVFRVNNDERAKIDLKVDPSWSYRTWGYVTLRAGDLNGEVVAEVRDDAGKVLEKGHLPIKGDGPAQPQVLSHPDD